MCSQRKLLPLLVAALIAIVTSTAAAAAPRSAEPTANRLLMGVQ